MATSEAKGNFAPVRTAHVCDMAQLRPPCFAAGPAPVAARCFPSVETTYHITRHVPRHVSIVLRVLNRMAAVAAKGNGACSHGAHARDRADATPLLRCRASPIIRRGRRRDMFARVRTANVREVARPCATWSCYFAHMRSANMRKNSFSGDRGRAIWRPCAVRARANMAFPRVFALRTGATSHRRGRRKRRFCACSQCARARKSHFRACSYCARARNRTAAVARKKAFLRVVALRTCATGHGPRSPQQAVFARVRSAHVREKAVFARVRTAHGREIARPRLPEKDFLRMFALRMCAK